MGGVQHRVDQHAMDRHDPVPIARATLLDHAADLDEAVAAIESGDLDRAADLVGEVLGAYLDTLLPHLPDGRSTEEQDLAPSP